jgi:hypothetical protein
MLQGRRDSLSRRRFLKVIGHSGPGHSNPRLTIFRIKVDNPAFLLICRGLQGVGYASRAAGLQPRRYGRAIQVIAAEKNLLGQDGLDLLAR